MGRVLGSFSVALITLFSIATGGDYPGIIGGTIELVLQQNFTDRGKEVVWKFNNGTKPFKLVAKFKDNKLETGHLQFQNHLEILRDANGLRITNLTLNYRGTYIAKITLDNHSVYEESFIVSLYVPIPIPTIRIVYEHGTSNTCIVTLHCDVTGNTSVSYTWIYRNGSEYQPYESIGDTVQVTLLPEPMEVLCIVQNLADRNNASVMLKPCQQKENHQTRHRWPVVAAISFFFIASCIILCKTILKKSVQETDRVISLQKNCADVIKTNADLLSDDAEEQSFNGTLRSVVYLGRGGSDIDPREEYHEFSSTHNEKEDDKIAFDDGELPSTSPLQKDSEII